MGTNVEAPFNGDVYNPTPGGFASDDVNDPEPRGAVSGMTAVVTGMKTWWAGLADAVPSAAPGAPIKPNANVPRDVQSPPPLLPLPPPPLCRLFSSFAIFFLAFRVKPFLSG